MSTYWYLRAPSEGTTIAQQVDVIDQQLGGRKDLGVWIDVESVGAGGKKLLTKDDVWAAKRELESRGYHVAGIYSGAWYFENMPGGEPSMDGLGYLWVSNYGQNRRGAPRDTYRVDGGDNHRGWTYPLGDRKPDILQFGSEGTVADWHPVDVNAFRGTRDELARIFHPDNNKEADMTTNDTKLLASDAARDAADNRMQLRGPGDNGWEQLGKNQNGQNLTLVDAVAAIRHDLAALSRKIDQMGDK